MRSFFKILSILVVGGTTAYNVVACNKCTTDNNGDSVSKIDTYNISFKEIMSINGDSFDFNKNWNGNRNFVVYEKDILGASGLPDNMWLENPRDGKFAYFYVNDDFIWDKVALVYGFNRSSTHNDIVNLMHKNAIVNVFMSINFIGKGEWKLLDFYVKND